MLTTTGPAPTTGAARPTTTYVYNGDGQITSQTNALNATTVFKYDSFGNKIEEDDPSPDGGKTAGPVLKWLNLFGDYPTAAKFAQQNPQSTIVAYQFMTGAANNTAPWTPQTPALLFNQLPMSAQKGYAAGNFATIQGPQGNQYWTYMNFGTSASSPASPQKVFNDLVVPESPAAGLNPTGAYTNTIFAVYVPPPPPPSNWQKMWNAVMQGLYLAGGSPG